MNFSRSRVLSTLLMCALTVAFSGVAEAQVCFARASNLTEVRAEGLTEVVGDVQLVCRPPATATAEDPFSGDAAPHKLTIAVELSSNITNVINDSRVVTLASTVTDATAANYVAPYNDGGISVTVRELGSNNNFDSSLNPIDGGLGDGKLSSDGETITWSIFTSADDPDTTAVETETVSPVWSTPGFTAVFSRVRVNAHAVGDGEDVMANVLVGGRQVNSSPLKVADVTTGLTTPVTAKSGDQCADGNIANARITVKEGFAGAFMDGDSFIVNFSGVPEGVSITVPATIAVLDDDADTSIKEDEETFRLVLEETNPRTSGVDKDNMVVLSNTGSGSVRYNIALTPEMDPDGTPDSGDEIDAMTNLMPDGALEWQHITPTFKWDKNDVDLGTVMVSASFHPVSNHSGDTFMTGGADLPRFMDASEAATIVTVKDCTSQLFYPFVTSNSGYDTGIVVSNTSDEAGSCSATYSGTGAPEDAVDLGEIMPGMQSVHLVSSHVADFSGYLTVNCNTTEASGFAHVVDTSGLAGSQGYIAE